MRTPSIGKTESERVRTDGLRGRKSQRPRKSSEGRKKEGAFLLKLRAPQDVHGNETEEKATWTFSFKCHRLVRDTSIPTGSHSKEESLLYFFEPGLSCLLPHELGSHRYDAVSQVYKQIKICFNAQINDAFLSYTLYILQVNYLIKSIVRVNRHSKIRFHVGFITILPHIYGTEGIEMSEQEVLNLLPGLAPPNPPSRLPLHETRKRLHFTGGQRAAVAEKAEHLGATGRSVGLRRGAAAATSLGAQALPGAVLLRLRAGRRSSVLVLNRPVDQGS